MRFDLSISESIYYEISGSADAMPVIFSHSLGQGTFLWREQTAFFSKDFRVIVYEQRGFGRSSSQHPPNTLEGMGRDVLALMDHLGMAKAHFCGTSIGGMVGQWLGIHAPERIKKLVLANTAAKIGISDFWSARAEAARASGVEQFLPGSAERWLTAEFRAAHPEVVAGLEDAVRQSGVAGYAAGCEVLATTDLRDTVNQINVPTLCIAGSEDPTTLPADLQFLAGQIPGTKYVELPAGHLACINMPEEWNAAVRSFFEEAFGN